MNIGSEKCLTIKPNNIPLLAVPTTAGTGSEATRFAVIYYGGNKQSVTSESLIPDAVVLDPDTLITLPLHQKKATMMDALCHSIESFWSINSTDESKEFSRTAIREILENAEMGAKKLTEIFDKYGCEIPVATEKQFKILQESVNADRLKNHPVLLDAKAISGLYYEVLI